MSTNITVKEPKAFVNEYKLCNELRKLNSVYTKQWFRTSNDENVKKVMNIDLMLAGVLYGIYTENLAIAYASLKKYNDVNNTTKNINYYLSVYSDTDSALFKQKYIELINGFVAYGGK